MRARRSCSARAELGALGPDVCLSSREMMLRLTTVVAALSCTMASRLGRRAALGLAGGLSISRPAIATPLLEGCKLAFV